MSRCIRIAAAALSAAILVTTHGVPLADARFSCCCDLDARPDAALDTAGPSLEPDPAPSCHNDDRDAARVGSDSREPSSRVAREAGRAAGHTDCVCAPLDTPVKPAAIHAAPSPAIRFDLPGSAPASCAVFTHRGGSVAMAELDPAPRLCPSATPFDLLRVLIL